MLLSIAFFGNRRGRFNKVITLPTHHAMSIHAGG